MTPDFLGEFEQMVLLAVLRLDARAFGLEVRREIEARADRTVSKGAFYTTLDRLERKGLLEWTEAVPRESRRNQALRLFSVTPAGLAALRRSVQAMRALGHGLDGLLLEDV